MARKPIVMKGQRSLLVSAKTPWPIGRSSLMHGWLEPSNKADRTRGPIIVGNMRFMLNLNAQGRPYLLKWYVRNRVGRWRWSICWAEWHKGKPIGIRRRAIAAM